MLIRMASRNLWRAKRRTLITLFTVAFGVWLSVTFTGMGDYMYTNMLDTGARMGFGHVTVQAMGYQETPGLNRPLLGAIDVAKKLRARPGIDHAVTRIGGQAMFASAQKSVGGMFFAIDPQRERLQDSTFLKAITEGELFTSSTGRGVVVGRVMAEKLGLRIGKRLVYTMVDKSGELVSEVAKVSAIFTTGVDDVDGSVALLPLGRIQKLVGYSAADGTHVATFLADHRSAEALRSSLGPELAAAGQEVLTFRQTQPELAGMVEIDRAMNYFFQILVALLVGAGVLNTILMSVLERRREFGVLMAIGARPSQLFGLVILESFMVGVLGLITGAILTAPWYIFMRNVGLDFSSAMEGPSAGGVLVDPIAKVVLYPSSAIIIAIGVIVVTVVAGLYPAWQAGREAPVDTLKAL